MFCRSWINTGEKNNVLHLAFNIDLHNSVLKIIRVYYFKIPPGVGITRIVERGSEILLEWPLFLALSILLGPFFQAILDAIYLLFSAC